MEDEDKNIGKDRIRNDGQNREDREKFKIRINKEQYVLLRKLIEKQSIHIYILPASNNDIIIEITKDDAEKIRDLAIDYFDIYGFNDKYELTDAGKLAEDLIDILYH